MTTGTWEGLPLVCPRCRGSLAVGANSAACAECGAVYPLDQGILRLTLGREGAPGYDPHYFKTLERVEGRHFWFVARREIVLDALRRKVPDLARRRLFDIGCGSGGLLEFLATQGIELAGACDAYSESLEIVRRRLAAPLVLVDEGRLPPLGPGHQLLALFDVLEHVDDDRGMLHLLHSALAPEGVVVLTVPAHPVLFDERDELACHRRRYRRGELRTKLEGAGFEVRLLTHFMAPLVPLLLALRVLNRLLPPTRQRSRERQNLEFRVVPVVNDALRLLVALERRLLRVGSLPFGSSIIAVAARGGGSS
jgi:2-polyprenyl-3-methyl-5-hydroxy-6-metoxy-1,4-benzoquinol methylase